MRTAYRVAVVLVLVLSTAVVWAQGDKEKDKDKPLDASPLDTALAASLKDVINRGADLYNAGDPAACYRVYEGALLAIKPLLDHKPDLQKQVTKALASVEKDAFTWRRAFTLRSTLDKVRTELGGSGKDKDKDKEQLKMPKADEKAGES